MRVAFVGLGVMGYPMAGFLAGAGHEVTVYNRTRAKAKAWQKNHGGATANTPAGAAVVAEIVFCCVGDDPDVSKAITYKELHEEVCRFANVLKGRGVKKGDCISIYMPMVPQAAVAMLACTRIGAVHSIVFGGFSPEALKDRILDSDCQVVITADEGVLDGKCVT